MHRFLLYTVLFLAACTKPKEPATHGRYSIENRLAGPLHVSATGHHSTISLLTDSIPVSSTTPILEVTEGSGGSVMPANFLHTLVITTTDSAGATVQVYSGVNNGDWVVTQDAADRTEMVLVVE